MDPEEQNLQFPYITLILLKKDNRMCELLAPIQLKLDITKLH